MLPQCSTMNHLVASWCHYHKQLVWAVKCSSMVLKLLVLDTQKFHCTVALVLCKINRVDQPLALLRCYGSPGCFDSGLQHCWVLCLISFWQYHVNFLWGSDQRVLCLFVIIYLLHGIGDVLRPLKKTACYPNLLVPKKGVAQCGSARLF